MINIRDVSFRYMIDSEIEQHGLQHLKGENSIAFLVANYRIWKAFLVLNFFYDDNRKINSYMTVFFNKGDDKSWVKNNHKRIHKAANKYAIDNTDLLVLEY